MLPYQRLRQPIAPPLQRASITNADAISEYGIRNRQAPKWIHQLCLLLASIFSSVLIHASDFGEVATNQDDFLPVEEAYQVLLDITDKQVGINWTMASGYYLYQHKFHVTASNTEQQLELALSFAPGKRIYDEYYGKELEVYYFNTYVEAEKPALEPPYELKVVSQGCADAGLCYPPRKQYFLVDASGMVTELERSQLSQNTAIKVTSADATTAPVSALKTSPTTASTTISAPAQSTTATTGFVTASVLALLGGIVLNLMPCVFPVLSLKALSFANNTHQQQHLHGWAYTGGVVGSFLVAAIIILAARQAGEMLGWGFQLQQPVFVAVLVYLFLVMGLSLFGMFSFGSQFMGIGQQLTTGSGLRASFFTGVLAAVVASPCSAPFMATALGAALTQPAPLALMIFAFLGLGMSLPFLALSYSPTLAKSLPAPGPWMEILKQALAFPLLATSIWLLWVLGHQTGTTGITYILTGAVLLCFALWLARFKPDAKTGKITIYLLIIVSLLAVAHFTWHVRDLRATTTTEKHQRWETFSQTRLNQLRADGQPVFINLTADWCITCKVNERVAFSSDVFFSRAQELGVTLLIGDWTNPNDEIAALLKQHNRNGIPLYLVYPKGQGGTPQMLSQILTPSTITEALEWAAGDSH